MYTALERNRAYRINDQVMVYEGRVFEEDLPPTFVFAIVPERSWPDEDTDPTGGLQEAVIHVELKSDPPLERVAFFLDQLTKFEMEGKLLYIGVYVHSRIL